MTFTLHPRLMADTALIADWPLSRVLLMNDRRFPWVILVPRRPDVTELFDLEESDRIHLMADIVRVSRRLREWAGVPAGPRKINIGIIGNIVPQLHIHVVARVPGDAAWPGAVWGAGEPLHYGAAELPKVVEDLRDSL